ncbi:M15 family metallopeptidase [Pasteurella multocida]|uniref:M15 family metallopeptidase n=1 Tax=Pasteurella multocida TaxID=747 RepID=UPI0020204B9D|nr:M15 family metallopeptidase [Pasteurella multocida]MCL7784440.1 M15 family metallopeptidase [Pasteurella multocida]
MSFLFTPEQLTGKARTHLVALPCPFSVHHFLHQDCLVAFQCLQQSAAKHGFNLQPASSFRDFQRQQAIWNAKFYGERKVHDDQGNPLDLSTLSDWEKVQAILRWSALPGGSRHHWGTEIDVFDPHLLPPHQTLQLEPWEYEQGGYFFELSDWLQQNLTHFDFALPFTQLSQDKEIGYEPWHISYLPIAQQAQQQFNADILCEAWLQEEIAGKACLLANLAQIFCRFFI